MRLFSFLFLILFQLQPTRARALLNTAEAASRACQKSEVEFNKRFTQLEKQYLTISKQKVISANRPTWRWGRNKNEAVYLLHGFIGSPHEMAPVANLLMQKDLTVINDLIPGHGADGMIGNAYTYPTWVAHVEANLTSIRRCFKKVHLIGFSTGGLLLHNYAHTHADSFSPASLTLYSPFYQPDSAFLTLIGSAARYLTSLVPTKTLYTLTHFSDIKIAVLKPKYYMQQIPLDMAAEVQKLGEALKQKIATEPMDDIHTPVLLFVADGDRIIDQNATVHNVSQDFRNLQLVHFKSSKVPHHLMVKEVSPSATEVWRRTIDFIAPARSR